MRKFLSIVILALPFIVHTQTINNELWSEVTGKAEIIDGIDIEAVLEARYQPKISTLKMYSLELALSSKISKHFSIGLGYKMASKRRIPGYFADHTISPKITLNKKLGDFKFGYRNKFEFSKHSYFTEVEDTFWELEDRNRIKITYDKNKSKVLPFIGVESYHSLYPTFYKISNIRYGIGTDFDLKKKFEAGLAYYFKQELNSSEFTNIIEFTLSKEF